LFKFYRREQKWRPAKFQQEKSKIPLVIFGSGMFGKDLVKLKGIRCGLTGVFWRTLKKREAAGDLIAVTIDEHKTSRICNYCKTDSLESVKGIRGSSILVCKTCKILWQRDINASKNMMSISLAIWKGKGRPSAFSKN
jgi:transposase-like protein